MNNFEKAEQLLNDRLDILMNLPGSTPADSAFLNGAVQMLKALGLDYVRRDDNFEIFVPEVVNEDKIPMEDRLADIERFLRSYRLINEYELTVSDMLELSAAISTVEALQEHSNELELITAND